MVDIADTTHFCLKVNLMALIQSEIRANFQSKKEFLDDACESLNIGQPWRVLATRNRSGWFKFSWFSVRPNGRHIN